MKQMDYFKVYRHNTLLDHRYIGVICCTFS